MVVRFSATSRAEIPRFPSSKIEKILATQVYSLFAPCVKSAKRYLKQAHLGMWDLRRLASVDSKSLNMVQDAQQTHWNV